MREEVNPFEEFRKMLKRQKTNALCLLAAILVVIAIGAIYFIEESIELRKELTAVSGELPNINQIDDTQTPILYDYVFGSMGIKSDIDLNDFGPSIVLAYKKDSDILNVLEQNWVNMYVPVLGRTMESVVLGKKSKEDFKQNMNEMDPRKVIEEGKWTFIFVSLYHFNESSIVGSLVQRERWDVNSVSVAELWGVNSVSKTGLWGNIQIDMDKTPMETPIYEYYREFGWKTEWLRKEPYITALKNDEQLNLDMNDPFWDKYNFMQQIVTEDGSRIIIQNTNFIRVIDAEGSNFKLGNEDELDSYLESKGN